MNSLLKKMLVCFTLISANAGAQSLKPVPITPGVSLELANFRKTVIDDIQYTLSFDIPAAKNEEIKAVEYIEFKLKVLTQPLQLDFKQPANTIKSIVVNSLKIPIDLKEEHLIIPQKYLQKDANKIELIFIAGNESLNRNPDYLYALFVPANARSVFPCFDQPDLKAKFKLSLTIPKNWSALANGKEINVIANGEKVTYHFANSDLLPTYLFSFTAGKYTLVNYTAKKRKFELVHRETDAAKLKFSIDSIFKEHQDAIDFLEEWTGIPYPFQKVGFAAIPDFQFGGMEHPGVVEYKASNLFLDEGATQDQFITRVTLISHETAHMWFGDMVTMKWFNDVWMKEVFANFMADKVIEKVMGKETFNLKFLQEHYPAAYGVDRTLGANPIRQQLDNLQDAGSMYGNIIYHKAPIMMRQLESLMGKESFKKGIREYLKKYAYSNATWTDLIAILSKYSKNDLYAWNKVWVNQPGRPVFNYDIKYANHKISKLTIVQQPEMGNPRLWPQYFGVTLVYPTYSKLIPVNLTQQQIILKEAEGQPKPLFILFNSDGMGYGLFPVDQQMENHLFNLKNPLERASAYINAYENMLSGRVFSPAELLKLYVKGISLETNEMNLKLLTGYISTIYWSFISANERLLVSKELESALWDALAQQAQPNIKKMLFKTYQDVYLSKEAGNRIFEIWQLQQAPAGIKLAEDDYISLALTLALKSDSVTTVLQEQRDRITNVERKNRLTFLMPALSLNEKERDGFFASLQDRKNRQKETWVSVGLTFLHHPLRQSPSTKYLPKSLEMLEEIQKTGDIFFPQSWLAAIFGSYQSKEAYQIVSDFLKKNPSYNPKLKDKILQTTDNLYRSQKNVNK